LESAEEVGDRSVSMVVWDVIIVLVIISIGGFFSGSEMALVSLREA
jgi:CBS domain containing-hemolysin-like protein